MNIRQESYKHQTKKHLDLRTHENVIENCPKCGQISSSSARTFIGNNYPRLHQQESYILEPNCVLTFRLLTADELCRRPWLF
jgi:hypothetical protein